MSIEWKTYRLGELVKVKGGKRLPKGISLQIAPNTHPYIRIRDMGKSRVLELDATYEYVDDVTQKSIARYVVDEGDILLSIVGTIGLVGIVGKSLHQANQTENCVKLVNLNGIDPLFLYYFLLSPKGQEEIKRGTVGAVQAKLPIKNIENIEISLPGLEEQRRIAGILGAIDDKIEYNRRINTNLELQAQALFDEWCKSCSKTITIKELADNILDYTPNENSEVVLLNSSDVTQGVFTKLPLVSNMNLKGQFKKRFRKGDILYSEIRPRNKHYAYCYFDSDKYIASTRLIVLRGKKEKIVSNTLLYQYLISQNVFEEFTLKTETRSGTFPQGNYQDLSSIVVPYSDNQKEIAGVLDSIYKRIWHNNTEVDNLATLRDTLLPKLMNGEIKL